jgi:phosphatidylserine decarboxylase
MLTKYGKREWLFSGVLCAVLSVVLLTVGAARNSAGLLCSALAPIIAWIFFALFFRDPPRKIPSETNVFVSPADGVVRDIQTVCDPFGGDLKFKRIGIFLSVFDVHINRAPFDMEVKNVQYKKGAFHDARSPLASAENESNAILCEINCAGKTFPLIVKQISGAIAKRIVSDAIPGSKWTKGEKYGMIKFGSRTELYLPDDSCFEILAREGGRVFAGSSILAKGKM